MHNRQLASYVPLKTLLYPAHGNVNEIPGTGSNRRRGRLYQGVYRHEQGRQPLDAFPQALSGMGLASTQRALRDMICRGLMLELSRAGHIELPPVRMKMQNPLVRRKKPLRVEIDQTPMEGKLSDIGPIGFGQVRRTEAEALFNSLIEEHHYLGYCQPVGEHLKYLVFAKERPIACLVWSSAPRHIGSRDRFIGWTKPFREKNLSLIACNTRFLVLPWVRIPHLASHILGKMAKWCPGTGSASIVIPFIIWRHLSIETVFREPAILRPTGSVSARPQGGERTTRPTR